MADSLLTADALRWVNVAASLFVVALLLMGTMARWEYIPKRFKRIIPWVIFTYVIIAYGSGEIATADAEVAPGIRVMLMTLNLVGLIIALLWGIGDIDYSEETENARRRRE